ncbi:MAG: hypothetical protein QNJ45_01715 [Ardenticatenaceae bacterium]|nr:hypothetical protein [Ardenticatenaceae bacterium]
MVKFLFLLNLLATIFMTGVIWMVQVVHYPLFAQVGEATWRSYHANHNVLITLIVLPAMVLEAGTAAFFLLNRPGNVTFIEALIGLALVGIAWGTTFFLSVPYHNNLAGGFNQRAYELLVSTNWLRTVAWSARSGLVLWQVWKQI